MRDPFALHFTFRGGGGTGGDRTRDPNIKSVVLYQLSYSPGVEAADSIPNCTRACNQIFPQTAIVV